jgi:hypothetical protein
MNKIKLIFIFLLSLNLNALTLSENKTMNEDWTVTGNLINKAVLNLNGFKLIVSGNYTQTAGTLQINKGSLLVAGNLDIKSGYVTMNNSKDYLLVEGNAIFGGYSSTLSAGTIEIKGDLSQYYNTEKTDEKGNYLKDDDDHYIYTRPGYNNSSSSFRTSGTLKVLLSGDKKQTVSYDTPNSSYIQNLELKNSSEDGVELKDAINITTYTFNDTKVKTVLTKTEYTNSLKLYSDVDYSDKDLILSYGTLDLNGKSLKVKSFTQTNGTLKINKGSLLVAGNLDIKSGYVTMNNSKDYLLVEGNAIFGGYSSTLSAGTIEIKGDLSQYYNTKKTDENGNYLKDDDDNYIYTRPGYSTSSYQQSFSTSGTLKVLLSGDKKQTVSFDTPNSSYIKNLELKNSSEDGVEFASTIKVYGNLGTKSDKLHPQGFIPENITLTDHKKIYPSFDRDGDNIGDNADSFPDDITVSDDFDNDGKPDGLHEGYTQADTNLTIDDYINTDFDEAYIPLVSKYKLDRNIFTLEVTEINQEVQKSYREFSILLINNTTKKKYDLSNNFEFESITHPDDVRLEDGKVVSSINSQSDVMFKYSNLAKIISMKFSNTAKTFTKVDPLSYKKNPQSLNVDQGYKDQLTDINYLPIKTRWYKLNNVKSNRLYNFIYQIDSSANDNDPIFADDGSMISYKLYKKDSDNNMQFVGSKTFDPNNGFSLGLVFEDDYEYFVEFSVDDMMYYTNYKLSLMEVKTAANNEDFIYFHKIKINENGIGEMDLIIPRNSTYLFTIKSENDSSATISKRGETDIIGENGIDYNKIYSKKAGIYKLKVTSVPNSYAYFTLKKSDKYLEIESNDNISNAMNYEGDTLINTIKNENDIFMFTPKNSYYNSYASFSMDIENIEDTKSRLSIQLRDTAGERYATFYPLTKNNTISHKFDGYDLVGGKTYYLDISIKKSSQDSFKYNLKINNTQDVLSKQEETFTALYESWKDSQGTIKLDENLNAVFGEVKTIDAGSLIIVTGDSDNPSDPLYEASQKLSKTFYKRFNYRGLMDEDIMWHNANTKIDIDSDGVMDDLVDNSKMSLAKLYKSIEDEATKSKNGPLYLYMVDHGSNGSFKLSSNDIDGDGQKEILKASVLKDKLNDFVTATSRDVIVIIEACKSGSFIPVLTNQGTSDKIAVITSSQAGKLSYIDKFGNISFTKFLADELLSGKSLNAAFNSAKDKLHAQGSIYKTQIPMMSASTDRLKNIKIGGNFAAASMSLTTIDSIKVNNESVTNSIDISSGTIDLEASITAGSGLTKVWATIITPDYTPPVLGDFETPDLSKYIIELSFDKSSKKYKGSYILENNYTGKYDITVYVEDVDGLVYSTNDKIDAVGDINLTPTTTKKQITSGWTLTSVPTSTNIEDIKNIESFEIVWSFDNDTKKWSAYSSDEDVIKNIKDIDTVDTLDTTSINNGYWIKSNANSYLEFSEEDKIQSVEELILQTGWNLVSTKKISDVENKFNTENIDYVWAFENNKWSYYSNMSKYQDYSSFAKLNSIKEAQGYWIYKH